MSEQNRDAGDEAERGEGEEADADAYVLEALRDRGEEQHAGEDQRGKGAGVGEAVTTAVTANTIVATISNRFSLRCSTAPSHLTFDPMPSPEPDEALTRTG